MTEIHVDWNEFANESQKPEKEMYAFVEEKAVASSNVTIAGRLFGQQWTVEFHAESQGKVFVKRISATDEQNAAVLVTKWQKQVEAAKGAEAAKLV